MPAPLLADLVAQLAAQRGEHLQAATATSDLTNQRDLVWRDVTLTYGDYGTHLTRRLSEGRARGVTHFWRERVIRAGAANKQNEGLAFADLSDASPVLPVRKTNTCQIVMGKVSNTGSVAAEASLGRFGDDLTEFLQDQTDAEMKGILKDIDKAIITGVESTSDPRAMDGLAGLIGTWGGVIQTNQVNAGADDFAEVDVDTAVQAIADQTNGGFVPSALYLSGQAALEMKGWTDKVSFVKDIGNPAVVEKINAGECVGYYHTHLGAVLEVFIHPEIVYSGTAANNFALVLTEELLKIAFLRGLHVVTPAKTGDAEEAVIIGEVTLECKAEKGHALIKNFTCTA